MKAKRDEDGCKMDETYYFGVANGKAMKKMKRRELYELLAATYQLAGSFLIGASIIEHDYSKDDRTRIMNGWTEDEMSDAIEVLLDFLSCPAKVTMARIDKARKVFRPWPPADAHE